MIVILEKPVALAHERLVVAPDTQVGVFAGFESPNSRSWSSWGKSQHVNADQSPWRNPCHKVCTKLAAIAQSTAASQAAPIQCVAAPASASTSESGNATASGPNTHKALRAAAPAAVLGRQRADVWGRFHGMDLQRDRHSSDSIPAWPDSPNPTGLAPDTARLRRLPAPRKSGPYRTASMERSGRGS